MTSAKNQQVLIELKNGETINGNLVNCDSWMNLTLNNVIQSFNNGESFNKLGEVYIRGNHIKYLRLPEEVCLSKGTTPDRRLLTSQIMDHAKEQNLLNQEQRNRNQKRRTGGFGRNYNNTTNRRNFNGNQDNNRGGYNNRRFNNNSNQQNNQHQAQ